MVEQRRASSWRHRAAALALALSTGMLAGAERGSSQEVPVPANLQARLWVKVLSFDRALGTHARREVVFGILVQRDYRASLDAADALLAAVANLPSPTKSEPALRPVVVDAARGPLADQLDELAVEVLYLTPLRGTSVAEVLAATRPRAVRTLTGVPEYVREGVGVGLGLRDDRPELLVNLEATRAEGAELSSQLLNLARLVQ